MSMSEWMNCAQPPGELILIFSHYTGEKGLLTLYISSTAYIHYRSAIYGKAHNKLFCQKLKSLKFMPC